MFVEPNPRYADPYGVDPDDETEGKAVLVEDGEQVLQAHDVVAGPADRVVYFVDGVRRTDFRAHDLLASGLVARGLAGSYGVGAVCCRPGVVPEFGRHLIERRLFWTHGHDVSLPRNGGWQWTTLSLATTDADRLLAELQREMRDAEAYLAGELAGGEAIVVSDGPLNPLHGIAGSVVGLVKSHRKLYLPPERHREVPALLARPGQRTSLFTLRDDAWGCYLRLPTTGRVSPWAGIVRIDVPAAVGLEAAAGLADWAAATLPRYSGVAFTDPRAPANLQPIAALESRLRHLFGDPAGALRAGMDAAAAEAAVAATPSAVPDAAGTVATRV